ncbi:MAG: Uma2 family endonuclease [Saprospiraceae bacterium]|nr:Uma2 family endonuclease [Saprospiraceae bacterium]MDW8230054.1 Uma2 family endonuclease [Saprospiraceae bacterium]
MTATIAQPDVERLSLEEYFEREWNATVRHEYIGGRRIPMTYATENHGLITHNLGRELGLLAKGSNIRIYQGDRMVYAPACAEVYYPDLVVVAGKPEYFDYKGRMKATTNPTALAEVLSETTEAQDKGHKWQCYREMPLLRQYCLVYQDRPLVEYYVRHNESPQWLFAYASGLEATLPLLGFDIPLREIYALVEWETSAPEETPPTP